MFGAHSLGIIMNYWLLSATAAGVVLCSGCSKPAPEELFAKAERAKKQAEAAVDTTTRTERLHALFAPALESYAELIDTYPTSGLADSALYTTGVILNGGTHEYQLAVDSYKRYLTLFPNGVHAEQVLFMIGYLYNNELHNLDSAGAFYRRYLGRYPNGDLAASAAYELGTLGKSPDDLLPKEEPAPANVAAAKTEKQAHRRH